jgi:hypothetical protein
MIDAVKARIAAHQRNLMRYRRILTTPLTDVERDYVKRRMEEERSLLEQLERTVGADAPKAA